MAKRYAYGIELNVLTDGNNRLEFLIDESFLQNFQYSPVKQANVAIVLNLHKSEFLMKLDFYFSGTAQVICDTCLTEITYPIDARYRMIIKKAEESNFSNDEIIYLGKNEIELDLTQYFYESFILCLPSKIGCENIAEPKPCNKEMLAKLTTVDALIDEPEKEQIDPRWDKLKDIIKNN
jgi:uncharacterized metal-binding protein YceD (DUF177 family)